MTPRKVLLVGDFFATTGFGTVNHSLAKAITAQAPEWTFYVLGINATGDPNPLREQFPHVYPAAIDPSQDSYGMARLADVVEQVQPDLLFIHVDSWLAAIYMKVLALRPGLKIPPAVVYCPPDAKNQPAGAHLSAYKVAHVVTPTVFGRDEVVAGGYDGPTSVIPYGIDERFTPLGTPRDARMRLDYPEKFLDAFVVGRGDRNAQRKRYDLSFEGFALAWKELGKPEDLVKYCHCQLTSTQGYDLPDLAKYYGVKSQIMATGAGHKEGRGIPDSQMPDIYRAWNVHLSTAMGEGFGYSGFESAACAVPQIMVDYAAYGEYFQGAAFMLPVRGYHVTIGGPNTLGGVTGAEDIAKAIVNAYAWRDTTWAGNKALAVARRPEFTWSACASSMLKVWNEVISG